MARQTHLRLLRERNEERQRAAGDSDFVSASESDDDSARVTRPHSTARTTRARSTSPHVSCDDEAEESDGDAYSVGSDASRDDSSDSNGDDDIDGEEEVDLGEPDTSTDSEDQHRATLRHRDRATRSAKRKKASNSPMRKSKRRKPQHGKSKKRVSEDDEFTAGESEDENGVIHQKVMKRGNWKARLAVIAARANIKTVTPNLEKRQMKSLDEFNAVWSEYCQQHFASFRYRDGTKTETHNKTSRWKVPNRFEYSRRVLYCTHGVYQSSRSKGERNHARIRYTGCPARLTLVVRNVATGAKPMWRVCVSNEVQIHNHKLTKHIFTQYMLGGNVSHADLLDNVDLLLATNTKTQQISGYVSHQVGCRVTSQQIRNLAAGRLGGANAEARMKGTLEKYVVIEGNRCALIQDAHELTAGLVLQSRTQAEVFARWPSTLVMDWTYGTNNLGYNLGALMVTGPTGRGLPVCEFLSTTETKDSLTTILTHFKNTNPKWTEIEAFIIDKDFTEWSVLEKLFPNAMVFLCQFHVAQTITRTLSQAKFALSTTMQANIGILFSRMTYARSEEAFNTHLAVFRAVVLKASKKLWEYFEKNWFPVKMHWSNIGRAESFSCGNSTTNRIETNWTQVKALLGGKTAIDVFLKTLLQHQVSVYRDLEATLATLTNSSRTFIGVSWFLHPVGAVLSDMPLEKIVVQYAYMRIARRKWTLRARTGNQSDDTAAPLANATRATLKKMKLFIVHTGGEHLTVRVTSGGWTCTCYFHVSIRLPCQHIMFVAHEGLGLKQLPARCLHDRWNLVKSVDLLDVMTPNVNELSKLRYETVGGVSLNEDEVPFSSVEVPRKSKVKYVRLQTGQRKKNMQLVMSPLDKKKIIDLEMARTKLLLCKSGSSVLYEQLQRLRVLLDKFCDECESQQHLGDIDADADADAEELNNAEQDEASDVEPEEDETDGVGDVNRDGCDTDRHTQHSERHFQRRPDEHYEYSDTEQPSDTEHLSDTEQDEAVTEQRRACSPDRHFEYSPRDEFAETEAARLEKLFSDDGRLEREFRELEDDYQPSEDLHDVDDYEPTQDLEDAGEYEPTQDIEVAVAAPTPGGEANDCKPTEQHSKVPDTDLSGLGDVPISEIMDVEASQHSLTEYFCASPSDTRSASPISSVTVDGVTIERVLVSPMKYSPKAPSLIEVVRIAGANAVPDPGPDDARRPGKEDQKDEEMKHEDDDEMDQEQKDEEVGHEDVCDETAVQKGEEPQYSNTWRLSHPSRADDKRTWHHVSDRDFAAEKAHRRSWRRLPDVTYSDDEDASDRSNASDDVEDEPPRNYKAKKPVPKKKRQTKRFSKAERERQRLADAPMDAYIAKAGLEVLHLPTAAVGNQRKETRTRRRRLALELELADSQTEECNIPVCDFNFWVSRTHDIELVARKIGCYPCRIPGRGAPRAKWEIVAPPYGMHSFRIPKDKVVALQVHFDLKREQAQVEGAPVESPSSEEGQDDDNRTVLVGTFKDDEMLYTEPYVMAVLRYYQLKGAVAKWRLDYGWVKNITPSSEALHKIFLAQSTGSQWTPWKQISANVKKEFPRLTFGTRLLTERVPTTQIMEIPFSEVIDNVARDRWISGTVLAFILNHMLQGRNDVFVVDPLTQSNAAPLRPPPDVDLTTIHFVIHPVLVNKDHWIVIIVNMIWKEDTVIVYVYEPRMSTFVQEIGSATWQSVTIPFLEEWLRLCQPQVSLGSIAQQMLGLVAQAPHDAHNYGFLCIAVVHFVVFGHDFDQRWLRNNHFHDSDLEALRMKCLHLLLCDTNQVQAAMSTSTTERLLRITDAMERMTK